MNPNQTTPPATPMRSARAGTPPAATRPNVVAFPDENAVNLANLQAGFDQVAFFLRLAEELARLNQENPAFEQ